MIYILAALIPPLGLCSTASRSRRSQPGLDRRLRPPRADVSRPVPGSVDPWRDRGLHEARGSKAPRAGGCHREARPAARLASLIPRGIARISIHHPSHRPAITRPSGEPLPAGSRRAIDRRQPRERSGAGQVELAMDKPNGALREALTFDDVLLKPGLSEVLPSDADIRSRITREIALNIPIVASAMDTVTEARMAIAMAQAGGIGVIHRNLEPEEQAAQVRQVKKFESGMVVNPLTIDPDATLADALDLMQAPQHLRHSGGRGRRQRQGRQARRHPHQPRRALRHRPAPDGLRADDQGAARHRARGRRPGRGQAAPAPAPHREAAGGRRASTAASA